jgi:hypothetical protein
LYAAVVGDLDRERFESGRRLARGFEHAFGFAAQSTRIPASARARCNIYAANLLVKQGTFFECKAPLGEGVALAGEMGETGLELFGHLLRSWIEPDYDKAMSLLRDCEARAEAGELLWELSTLELAIGLRAVRGRDDAGKTSALLAYWHGALMRKRQHHQHLDRIMRIGAAAG